MNFLYLINFQQYQEYFHQLALYIQINYIKYVKKKLILFVVLQIQNKK